MRTKIYSPTPKVTEITTNTIIASKDILIIHVMIYRKTHSFEFIRFTNTRDSPDAIYRWTFLIDFFSTKFFFSIFLGEGQNFEMMRVDEEGGVKRKILLS